MSTLPASCGTEEHLLLQTIVPFSWFCFFKLISFVVSFLNLAYCYFFECSPRMFPSPLTRLMLLNF